MPSLRCAVIPLPGAPRHGGQGSSHVIRAGRDRRAPPSVLASAALVWGPRPATADTWAIRGSPPARAGPPTRAGAPRARATSTRARGAPVLRSPWPLVTAACCAAARRAPPPVCQRRSPGAPACAQRVASRRVSVLTTAGPVPPLPAPVCHRAPRRGCAWASCRRALSPVTLRQTAAMNGGPGRSTPRPRVPRPPPGAPNRTPASAAAKHAPARAPTQPAIGTRPPHAMRAHRVRGPPHCRREHILTASRGATSVPTMASGGTSTGSTCHPPALAE
jgi:hypothetical protein